QAGRIHEGRVLQAKGQDFTVAEFLADDERAKAYRDGNFVTVYLSPRDYHRVHMPLDGELIETVHVPGRLFSVAPAPVAQIPRLFARNERLICHFESTRGPFVVALVGAMLVSGVTTVWHGREVPPYAAHVVHGDWRGRGVKLARFAEMGRFEMGSTVILLLPKDCLLSAGLLPEMPVRVGQRLGHFPKR
ncbi:MAG: phosphatidylserine decarboxylase, partial [Rhodanobacteraceae bacterium]